MSVAPQGLVSLFPPREEVGQRCGYCKGSNGSISDGLWAYQLSPSAYQALIDRGFRRSGQYVYKPRMKQTCCPQYTIRLDVTCFRFSRSHRKVIKRFLGHLGDSKSIADQDLEQLFQRIFSVNGLDDSPRFKVVTVPSKFEQESFELYKKYQITVHKDKESELTQSSYERFLVKSPLNNWKGDEIDDNFELGSFHQKYYLDGKLIAVGVIDFLPNCLSSVYFYYDPDLNHLSLGNFSALFEIYQTLQHHQNNLPSLQYYYMGFYIHSCEKMKYKGKYEPSDLCDPMSYEWYPLSEWIPQLETSKFYSFSMTDEPDELSFRTFILPASGKGLIPISYHNGNWISQVDAISPTQKDTLVYFCKIAGKSITESLVIVVE